MFGTMPRLLAGGLGLAMLATVPQIAAAEGPQAKPPKPAGWQFSVGLGAIAAPKYLGDNAYSLSVVPDIRVAWSDRFFASVGQGVGYNVINADGWRAGPILKYDFGRDEDGSSPFSLSDGDTNDLRGLGDVDGTFELGGFVEYTYANVAAKLELRQGIGGHEGLIGDAELKYKRAFKLGQSRAIVTFGPELAFGSSNYMSTYFDVNAAQAAASGLTAFDADGGLLSYGIGGSLTYLVTQRVAVTWFAGYDRLTGDAADSSLVKERGSANQFGGGLFVSYTF
ncbi:MAG: MipA/OmpV family protein [Minwuia sp.]|nr:MipA/OmpV family protein [Minwuia sp.]